MPGFLGDEQVRKVKAAVDLVQVMSEYAPLRKAGRNWTCCCPFHQERTPSCYIYAEQQTYHCFGCGAHGDVISLVRDKERLEFTEAVELLARRAGITLEYQAGGDGRPKGERDALLAAVAFAAGIYERLLWESPEAAEARAYLLERRRLRREVCERFRLGWAPGGGQLVDAARRQGMPAALLAQVDLAVERAGRLTDRFFERITFPICDRFGNPIAFSARLLPEAERAAKEAGRGVGKYVNSTDTPLYHKSQAVFNLHQARVAARDAGRLLVMEGPTDVMAADQAGVRECVAALGTALTPSTRASSAAVVGDGRLVILLDGDSAGQANSLKAIRTCLSVGVPVQVAVLPDELDPAELFAEGAAGDGRAVFERVLAGGRADIDHLLRTVAPRPYELDAQGRLAAIDEVLAALRPMPDATLRVLHLGAVAEWFGMEAARLEKRLAGVEPPPPRREAEPAAAAEPPLPGLEAAQEVALHLLVRHPALRGEAFDDLGLEPGWFPGPYGELAAALQLAPDADAQQVLATAAVGHPGVHRAVARWLSTTVDARFRNGPGPEPGDEPASDQEPGAEIRRRVAELRIARLRAELLRLTRALAEAERERDFTRVRQLAADRVALTRELKDLEGQSGGA